MPDTHQPQSSLGIFLNDVARELQHQLNYPSNKHLPFEVIQRLEEIARELNAAAYQIKRKESKS